LTVPDGLGGKDIVHFLLALDPSIMVIASSGYARSGHIQSSQLRPCGPFNQTIPEYKNEKKARISISSEKNFYQAGIVI
jgi:hypothetical protein